tara:strand:- start:257 stop:715 length:459 start_codon:yes stop_codon:yes gene_type:complete
MLITLFSITTVSADVYTPYLGQIYGISITIFLIPIILIEGIATYFLLKKLYNLEIKLWHILIVFLIANILSALIGFIFSGFFPIGSRTVTPNRSLLLALAFFISSLVEFPIIYAFLRKKTREALKISVFSSFLVNLISYIMIFFLMLTTNFL